MWGVAVMWKKNIVNTLSIYYVHVTSNSILYSCRLYHGSIITWHASTHPVMCIQWQPLQNEALNETCTLSLSQISWPEKETIYIKTITRGNLDFHFKNNARLAIWWGAEASKDSSTLNNWSCGFKASLAPSHWWSGSVKIRCMGEWLKPGPFPSYFFQAWKGG